MKKLFNILILSVILVSLGTFISCDGYAKIKLENDNSVTFRFSGNIGKAFKEMMGSLGEDTTIDNDGIAKGLIDSGFTNVKVASQNDNIAISFTDENQESYIFNSGIISIKNDEIKLSVTADNFLELYNSSGEDIQMLLDLFLSPVLNDEEMTISDYIDTISVTYGEDAGKEIDKAAVDFSIIDKKGNKKNKKVFAKNILCGKDFSL